ncbi:MAG: ATP cone domain-containing protein [Planctomycetota bacterium]
MIGRIAKVRKRDGRLVEFDEAKIADAIHKAACAVGREDRFLAEELAGVVTLFLEKQYAGTVPGIEEIQDMVEKVLIETGHARMAKAYILYRERRARGRAQVRVHGEAGAGPVVGSPARARVSPWSKARIAEALVREADLDERLAAKVASSVERRVFGRGVERITTSAIRSLVEAELFERGFSDRVGRQALVGLPRYDVDRLLRGGKEGPWRPAGPRDLIRAVAAAVLTQYALSEIYGEEVVNAHLDGRLHLLDVGSPCEWLGAVAAVPPAADAEAWVEGVASVAGRLATVVTREVTLTDVVPPQCLWGRGAGPKSAIGAARRLLGHGALQTLDRGGGRLRLALSFAGLPEDEGAALLAEGLVREHWARFRAGRLEGLPEIVVHAPAARIDDERARRGLLPVVAAAAETGRVLLVFDRDEPAPLVTPWFRIAAPEAAAPAALPVAGAVAINTVALAGEGEETLLEALDAAIVLAIKALKQKRSFLAALQADPAGPLYRVAAGARPLVAGERGFELVHLVGVNAAARRLASTPAAAARLAGRLRSYAAVRIAEEGRRVRLQVCAAPDRDGEAAHRFFGPEEGMAGDAEPFALPRQIDLGERMEALLDPVGESLTLRFPRDEAPPPEALYDALSLLAGDPRIGAVRLVPWPDRSVHPPEAEV